MEPWSLNCHLNRHLNRRPIAVQSPRLLIASLVRCFEHQSFVNSYVLLHKTFSEEKKRRGEDRALLALFSNPNAPQQLHLKPLQLGQELKFLLRSIPPQVIAAESRRVPC